MAFSEETIQQVWEKATPVAGNDPAVWRQDQCKAWIGRRFYGNRNSEYGWEIDHIVPVSKGGTDVSIRPRACFSPSYNKVKSQTKHVWLLTLL